MKSKKQDAVDLEAELLRLNTLVRKRRDQLTKLEQCPNKDCECRAVWNQVVETELAGQVGKIRKSVTAKAHRKPAKKSPAKK